MGMPAKSATKASLAQYASCENSIESIMTLRKRRAARDAFFYLEKDRKQEGQQSQIGPGSESSSASFFIWPQPTATIE
jgi:hypothetical protein